MRSTRRAPSTTLAPCAQRCRAVASPSPLLAPVITTIFPSMLLLMASIPRLIRLWLKGRSFLDRQRCFFGCHRGNPHQKQCAKQTADAHQRDDATHRPGSAVREDTDERRARDAGTVLDRAYQRRHGARAFREAAKRTGNRVGDDEPGRRDKQKEWYHQSHQPAPARPGIERKQDACDRRTEGARAHQAIAAEPYHEPRIELVREHDADDAHAKQHAVQLRRYMVVR